MNQRFSKFRRAIDLQVPRNPMTGSGAVFLWGARQTGKTTLLRERFARATFYDLLDTDLAAELTVRPAKLREEVLPLDGSQGDPLVVIDEIQLVPGLLPEVHWLLENSSTRFVLCGSSARKLRRHARNLLGGRAIEHHLHPLTSVEIGEIDLDRLLLHGGIPIHYLDDDPGQRLRAYVHAYLKQEIIDESVTRNIPSFSRFLEVVALGHGQQTNYANVARESGVSASTVRNYYQILEDTLLGFTLEPWRRKKKRRLVDTGKFYLFDIGVANQLHPDRPRVEAGSDLYGRAFEHFVLNEVRAWIDYRHREEGLSFWRTSSGLEVDIIVGSMDLAIECKSTTRVRGSDLKGLRALCEEFQPRRRIVVSREATARKTDDGIELLPWQEFCEELWADRLVE